MSNPAKLVLGIAFVAAMLGGCSGGDNTTPDAMSVNKGLSTSVPEYNDLSALKLPNGRRFVSLGDTDDKALSIFPKPSRAFPLEDGIPGFPSDFHARGWESSTEGFGVILHDDKVVLAMHQWESVEPDEFAGILANVQDVNNLGRFQAITKNNADYWYVTSGRDELVVSRIPGAKKRYQVTITVGNQKVVEALGILNDASKAASPLQTQKNAH